MVVAANDLCFHLHAGSFAGLGFFSWYLAGKIQAFDRRGHIAKLCLVFLPPLVACMVSISLLNDYLHHWGDVFAGGLLGSYPCVRLPSFAKNSQDRIVEIVVCIHAGIVVGSCCYLQFYPPPSHVHGVFLRSLKLEEMCVLLDLS